MAYTQTDDLNFQTIHSVKNLKDAYIYTLDEEPEWLGAEATSVLSHIREIVKKLKQLESGGTGEQYITDVQDGFLDLNVLENVLYVNPYPTRKATVPAYPYLYLYDGNPPVKFPRYNNNRLLLEGMFYCTKLFVGVEDSFYNSYTWIDNEFITFSSEINDGSMYSEFRQNPAGNLLHLYSYFIPAIELSISIPIKIGDDTDYGNRKNQNIIVDSYAERFDIQMTKIRWKSGVSNKMIGIDNNLEFALYDRVEQYWAPSSGIMYMANPYQGYNLRILGSIIQGPGNGIQTSIATGYIDITRNDYHSYLRLKRTTIGGTLIGTTIGSLVYTGLLTSGYGVDIANIYVIATQNFTDIYSGSQMDFVVNINNSTEYGLRMRFTGDNKIHIPAADPNTFMKIDANRNITYSSSGLSPEESKKIVQIKIIPDSQTLTTGDGKFSFCIPAEIDRYNIFSAHAFVSTASTSGLPTIQLRNVTNSTDILSTRITIDENEYTSYSATTEPKVDGDYAEVLAGDIIAIDIDVAGTGTKGLGVIITFELP